MVPPYLEELLSWRRQKEDDLRRRDGWLALAGLHWLTEGNQSAGAGQQVDLRLPPPAPAVLGDFEVRGGKVFFRSATPLASGLEGAPPVGQPLQPDTAEDPTFLRVGELTLIVIERGQRIGLRVWDNARRERTAFVGRSWYPPDPAFRIEADFDAAAGADTIPVPDVIGNITLEPLLGTARFTLEGRPASLRAVPTGEDRLWFLFADATNGSTTYPAGRFLVAEPPRDGVAVLDFNRAYNPPCAFTPFATCPLPPEGNRLTVPVAAGETYSHEPRA